MAVPGTPGFPTAVCAWEFCRLSGLYGGVYGGLGPLSTTPYVPLDAMLYLNGTAGNSN